MIVFLYKFQLFFFAISGLKVNEQKKCMR